MSDIAKEKIVELLRDDSKTLTEKSTELRAILDEFKGSYAARYFLEAIKIMGANNPTDLVVIILGPNSKLLNTIELLKPGTG